MRKSYLIKAGIPTAGLAVVAVLIFSAARIDSSGPTQQSFFEQFFLAGGLIVWFVLFPMSLLTVFLIAEYCLTISRRKLLRPGQTSESLDAQLSTLDSREDLVGVAVKDAIEKGRGDWIRMRSAMTESLQEQAQRLLRKIEWLNLIGGVSPMVGLFGTVFGMIKLFNSIVAAGGQPQPAHLADGIGIALVTTFWGLFIAIPALAMHGVFRNRIETLVSEAVTECEKITPLLKNIPKAAAEKQPVSKPIKWANVPVIGLTENTKDKPKRTEKSK